MSFFQYNITIFEYEYTQQHKLIIIVRMCIYLVVAYGTLLGSETYLLIVFLLMALYVNAYSCLNKDNQA